MIDRTELPEPFRTYEHYWQNDNDSIWEEYRFDFDPDMKATDEQDNAVHELMRMMSLLMRFG